MSLQEKCLIVAERPTERVPANLAEAWLCSEPLRRTLRAAGAEETFLTGNGSDFEKWECLLEALPTLKGSPLLDAVKVELKALGCRYDAGKTGADEMWREMTDVLAHHGLCPTAYLAEAGVETALVPTSPLNFDKNAFYPQNGMEKCRILPLFSPDGFFAPDNRHFQADVQALGQKTGIDIQTLDDFCAALEHSLEAYAAVGCPGGFHSTLVQYGFCRPNPYHAGEIFRRALTEKHPAITPAERALLFAQLMRFLGLAYRKHNMRMYLIPPCGSLGQLVADDLNCPENDTVCGVNAESGFCATLKYLEEYRGLPQTVIALSPATSYGILRELSGTFLPLDGQPRILWGIDGERATAADVAAIARAIRRENAENAFVGVLRDAPGFLTAPVTRMLAEQDR